MTTAHQAATTIASWWAEFAGGTMTYEEAVKFIPCGRYRHFKGNEYEVIGIVRHLCGWKRWSGTEGHISGSRGSAMRQND